MLEQRAVGAGMKRGAAKAALNGATLIAAVLGLMLSTACSQKSGSPTTQRVATTPTLLGFDEGLAAARRGDYVTALREFRPLAERGDANAQYRLGSMYGGGPRRSRRTTPRRCGGGARRQSTVSPKPS